MKIRNISNEQLDQIWVVLQTATTGQCVGLYSKDNNTGIYYGLNFGTVSNNHGLTKKQIKQLEQCQIIYALGEDENG